MMITMLWLVLFAGISIDPDVEGTLTGESISLDSIPLDSIFFDPEGGETNIIWSQADTPTFFFGDILVITDDICYGPVTINCRTGEVTVEPGYDLNSASIKFWRHLSETYPYVFHPRKAR